MKPKSGRAGTAIQPLKPRKAEEADAADPGEVSKMKTEQSKTQTGKYGSKKEKPHKKPNSEEEQQNKKSWIEILLQDEDGNPIPGEPYKVVLPDGSAVAKGTLDENGFARVDGIEPGQCEVQYPKLEDDQWKKG